MATPTAFLKEVKDELKKVTWPKQQEVLRLTFVVIVISIIVGVYIGGLDLLFAKAMELIVK